MNISFTQSGLGLAMGMLLLLPTGSFAQEQSVPPRHTSMCQIVKSPDIYAGTLVVVEARMFKKKKGQAHLWDFECGAAFLLQLPSTISPQPQFTLLNDEAFQRLSRAMRNGWEVHVEIVGRFDTIDSRDRDRGNKLVRGFGNKGKWKHRLVLKEVLKYIPVPQVD